MKISRSLRIALIASLLLLTCAVVGTFSIRHWSITKVKNSALKIADGRPYCIQIVGNGGYQEVRSLTDLSIFNMRSSSGDYHAVLVVGSEKKSNLLHWSYWKGGFVDGAIGPPAIYCTPEPDFLSSIEKIPRLEKPVMAFGIGSVKFSVPRSFRPKAIDGSPGPGMTFFAVTPNFHALANPPEYNKPVSADDIVSHIEINFVETKRPQVWLHKNSNSFKVENAGNEFGLNKQFVWYLDSNSTATVEYYLWSKDGRVTTLIHCPGEQAGVCIHTFYKNGWTYTFHHRPSELQNWQLMQEKLVSLSRSFVVSG